MGEQGGTYRPVAGPEKRTGVEVRVSGLPAERQGAAAGLLAHSFHTYPNFVDLFPDESARSRALPRKFAAGLRDASGLGHVYAAVRGVEGATRDKLAGVAVWLLPGAFPPSAARRLRALPGMTGVLAAAQRSARRLLEYAAGTAKGHPVQPYIYLE